MAVALSNALPVTAADGIAGRNTGRDIRKGLLSSLLLPDTKANPLAVRNGVLSHDYDSGGVKSLRVDQTGTASNQVIIQPGAFVSERAGQGPYIGWGETSAGVLLTPPGSDSTNPRIDVVYVQVLDKASISLDPSTDAIADVQPGAPSATPQVPAVTADGAVILAQIYRPAGSTTITQANITDKRRSTGLVGTVRRLLPGDFLSDPGKVDGELRYRQAVGGLPSLVDYWDASQGYWRGTQGFVQSVPFPGTPDTNGNVSGSVTGLANIVALTVSDPGWPYRIAATAGFQATFTATSHADFYVQVNGLSNNFASQLLFAGSAASPIFLIPNDSHVYTGSALVAVVIDPLGSGQVNWLADKRNLLTCRIDPA